MKVLCILVTLLMAICLLFPATVQAAAASAYGLGQTGGVSFAQLSQAEHILGNHTIFSSSFTDADPFPFSFVRQCLWADKTPLLTLRPSFDGQFPSAARLRSFAQSAASFSGAIYLNLFPYDPMLCQNPLIYQANWSEAAAIFRQYAPNVRLIWSLPADDAAYAFSFWPPQNRFDFLGISCFSTPEEALPRLTFTLRLLSAQTSLPIAITGLGISSFDTSTHRYCQDAVALALPNVYHALRSQSLAFVVYQDQQNALAPPPGVQAATYALSQDTLLANAYRAARSH